MLDVLVLGPVECRVAQRPLTVSRLLERALLVRLALAHGAPVPDERLATDLWGDEARDRPTERLRVVVSRLRVALGEHAPLLARTAAGYSLRATTPDAAGAEAAAARLARATRAGDHHAALAAATDALACWRGPALADLRTVRFGRTEGERLDAWFTDITVARLQAKLDLGAAPEMLTEVGTLATEHPLNERIWCMLALALYTTGRQAEALERLGRLRRALADELGIDPAPDTAELELRMLRHDPGLLHTGPDPRPTAAVAAVASRRRTWLPAPRTEFVGRDGELAAVLERLAEPGLITLVGVAGSGKSRLATEVARGVEETGRPVVFVELAPLGRAGSVVPALADTIGTEPEGGPDPLQPIAAALAGAVLVLDNAEHLVGEVGDVVGALLARTRGLTVLVTSQRALLLAAEHQHRIGPLPPATAAALFVSRAAGSARPDPSDVATICAAVDSLPLGIELAAGLTRTLTVAQLARRVNDRLRLLVGGSRDAGGRHTSLRAALDWSFELLGEREQAVLRRLGVFTGGFTLDAAEHVAAVGTEVGPVLADLAERSLVAAVPGADSTRYRLLETVREYAQAQLTAHGEMADARAAHLAWCLRFTRALDTDNVASVEAVTAVFGEWPNLRDALENAPGTARAVGALQLANTLHTAWVARGWFPEARRHLTTLAATPDAAPLDRARAFCNAGFHALMALRLDDAAALLDDAARLDTGTDDELTLAIRYHRGFVDLQRCRLGDAAEILGTGRALAHDLGLRKREAAFADALGTVHAIAGDSAAAEQCYRDAAEIDRARGDEHRLSIRLANLAQVLADLGRGAEALAAAEESDRYAREIDDRQLLPVNHMTRATVALGEGRLKDAEALGRDAIAISDGVDGSIWADFADILVITGELAEARELLDIAYSDLPSEGVAWLAARPISAALAFAEGDLDAARRIVEQTEQTYAALGFGWPRYAGRLAEVRRNL